MALKKNNFGVLQYPDDDARRLFVLLGAIDLLERATLSAISDMTGIAVESIDDDIDILCQQFGVKVHKLGNVYRIDSWGDILQRDGVIRRMREET